MQLDLELIHLLFAETSSEMVSMAEEAIRKDGKKGGKAELCQMTQELN